MTDALHVAITGSHGFVGSALVRALAGGASRGEGESGGESGGGAHRVTRLARRRAGAGGAAGAPGGEAAWDPATGLVAPERLEGVDAVVHLAGVSIGSGRWTRARKAAIRGSRVEPTRHLAASLAALARPPGVLVCASAIGYYGDRGQERLDESKPPGVGFLAEVCRDWEAAAEPARAAGIRVVHLRSAIVLGTGGGAFPAILLPFRFGVGGRIGSGRQIMSWITLDDVVGAILHTLATDSLAGPVNAAAPEPVTNAEFTRALARVLGRPALVPLPAWAARLALGEMADELLLASARVVPDRLLGSGFVFRHPGLDGALGNVLERRS